MNYVEVIKIMVKAILDQATNLSWSVQGLGMLRLYLSNEYRLHVWDDRLKVPNVSEIHDHPWDLESLVVAGVVRNRRLTPQHDEHGAMMKQTLRCGEGGGLVGTPSVCALISTDFVEVYTSGDRYVQRAEEVHQSEPDRGAVTLIHRTFREDTEHAHVFWPRGENWISAEPRPATREEVEMVTRDSLRRWWS